MKRLFALTALLISVIAGYSQRTESPIIEVTGSATVDIIPDRITIEIGMEEYYAPESTGDSVIVKLTDIERDVRKTLVTAGVPDSMIIVSELGNYRDRNISSTFLMAKRLSATVKDFKIIDRISEKLDRRGISSFSITKIDNSEIEQYNRQGLKSALDAAKDKAEFIADNEGLKLLMPFEIVETTNEPYGFNAFSNVACDGGSGMENMRRIVRRYSVKVRYLFSVK